MSVRVALVQLRTPDNHAEALAHVAPLVRRAAGDGARLIATPEVTNIVERDRRKLAPQLVALEADPVVMGLRALAADLGVEVLIGSALVKDGSGFANRSILVRADGSIAETYDKIHMFDADLPNGERYRESAAYTPGARAVIAPSALGLLGLTVCYDLRFPALFRALGLAEAGGDRCPGRVHPADRRGALGDAAARPRHRDRRLRARAGPGRHPRRRARYLGPFAGRRAVGRGDREARPRRARACSSPTSTSTRW